MTGYVRKYDEKLFCKKGIDAKLCIFREGYYYDTFWLDDQHPLHVLRLTPHFVFALTHNWGKDGHSVDWGKDKVWERLHKVDIWKRDIVDELEKQEDRDNEKRDRDRMNKTEDFLYEFRDDFKEAFKDVNTANLAKKDSRRIKDKSIHI
jgi:hypothetical protein